MASGELSERDVIRGAQAGDERMYRELVSRYVRPALAVAWEFTDSLDDAEDLVQEAFRRVVNALPRFEAGRPFAPWFFTILRNVARNAAGERALRLHAALDESVYDEGPTAEEVVEYLELQARVDVQLTSLPDMQRACFRLCMLEGLSSREVAEALGVSDATVRTHVYRARQAMRKAILPFVEEER
ncbi:MAG TPA: sigma-70 family RNA polymerase sigma factor [Gemmatimonadales bacterium]|nr:sigma-70 family RNA polymerase sigma factor [Gemmatimonadales bacterium]